MDTVLTQNDLVKIINSETANAVTASSQLLTQVMTSIGNVFKKLDTLPFNPIGTLKKVEKMVVSYNGMVSSIIETICKPLNGKDIKSLADIFGYQMVDDQKDTNFGNTKGIKVKQVEKWTTVDALNHIPNIINNAFKAIESFSKFKGGGLKSMFMLKRNLRNLKPMISEVFNMVFEALNTAISDKDIDKMLKCLIKQPDTIQNIVESNTGDESSSTVLGEYNSSSKNKIWDKSKTETITKQGQLGILDIFEKTFSVLSLLNSLKLPNFISLSLSLIKVKLQLQLVFKILLTTFNGIANKNNIGTFKMMGNLIGADDWGLNDIFTNLRFAIKNATKINLYFVRMKLINASLRRLGKIIAMLYTVLTSKHATELLSPKTHENIDSLKTSFNKVNKLLEVIDIPKFALLGIMGKIIIRGIKNVGLIIAAIVNVFIDDKGNINKSVQSLVTNKETIINALNSVEDILAEFVTIHKNLLIVGVLALPGVVAALFVCLFTLTLILLVNVINKLVGLIENIADDTVNKIKQINKVILALAFVGLCILLFALITPIIVQTLSGNILPFLLILAGAMLLMWVLLKLTAKLASKASGDAITIGISMLLIVGSLLLAAISILVLALVGKMFIDDPLLIGAVLLIIAGIILIAAAVVGLGSGLISAAPFIGIATGGITPVVILLALVMSAAITISVLGKIKMEPGKYKEGKDPKKGEIGSGTGVLGNIGMLTGIVKFLSEKIGNVDKSDIKNMRKAKRLMKQVNKVVKRLKKIAFNLNDIGKLNIDEKNIMAKTATLFSFVNRLNEYIEKLLGGEGEQSAAKQAISDAVNFIPVVAAINAARELKNNKARKANRKLNKVSKITDTLNKISGTLASIQDLNISESKITARIDDIFTVIDNISKHIATFMSKNVDPESIVDAQKLSKREWKKANEKLSKVEATIATVQGICDALNTIKDLKIEKEQDKIVENVKTALGSIDRIAAIISGGKESKIDKDKLKAIETVIDYVKELNEAFIEVGNANSANVEKNIGNYVKFIDKVNTMDVEKVKKTAQMFEKMSRFSTSIKGDFDKLAEALSDKLLPVLEDLKEVMGVLPEKLDTGFQNTAAAVASTNAPATKENITAQVNRENPNLTTDEVNKIVESRISEAAKADANGVAAKLDELISLLRGYGGDVAVVKTL